MKMVNNFKTLKKEYDQIPVGMRGPIIRNLFIILDNYGEDSMPDNPFEEGCDGGANIIVESSKDFEKLMADSIISDIPECKAFSKKNDYFEILYLNSNDFGVSVFMNLKVADDLQRKYTDFLNDALDVDNDTIQRETGTDWGELTQQEYIDKSVERYEMMQ